jgi:hypothetical protein
VLSREYRQRVMKNRVLRTTFGYKRAEVARDWRKFHTVELHNF